MDLPDAVALFPLRQPGHPVGVHEGALALALVEGGEGQVLGGEIQAPHRSLRPPGTHRAFGEAVLGWEEEWEGCVGVHPDGMEVREEETDGSLGVTSQGFHHAGLEQDPSEHGYQALPG